MDKKVLVVDDEELIRDYVRRALASRGFSVETAVDGASAAAAAGRENFDVVICDLKMPDMRGEEVIRKLAAMNPKTKIIVITGSVSNISPVIRGVQAAGYLIKPFGINEIRDLVEKVLA